MQKYQFFSWYLKNQHLNFIQSFNQCLYICRYNDGLKSACGATTYSDFKAILLFKAFTNGFFSEGFSHSNVQEYVYITID